MKPVKEAKRYAKTLINIIGMDNVPAALGELIVVDSLMGKSREFRSLLVNPAFTAQDRAAGLDQVAKKANLSAKVVGFLAHLCEAGVIAALGEIVKIATALYMEKKKKAKAVVMSPIEVGKAYEERLRASLRKMMEREVDIEFVIDPSLLGGVLVKVGSTMYDSSIRGQLRLLKDELIKG